MLTARHELKEALVLLLKSEFLHSNLTKLLEELLPPSGQPLNCDESYVALRRKLNEEMREYSSVT